MIVLTGSTGFVGRNLSSYLSRYHDITPLSRAELENVNERTLVAPSLVVHLAGKAHDLRKAFRIHEYYHANYLLTKGLYDAFLKADVRKFIFVSSVKAVTDSLEGTLREDIHAHPATHYGKSKLLAERYIQSQPLPPGKSYYILRPCMIHGPGNKGNLNLLNNLVLKGIPYPLASYSNKRSFLSVENLCFIIKEIIERDDIPSGIYNVADDEPLSTNEVVTLLAEAQNRSPRLLHVPKGIITSIAKLGDKLHLPLTTERLEKLTENFVVSNEKIKAALNKELPVSCPGRHSPNCSLL